MIDHPEPTSKGRSSRPRLYLIQPFSLPIGSPYVVGPAADAPRTERLMNYEHLGLGRLLEGCDWKLDPGPPRPTVTGWSRIARSSLSSVPGSSRR